PCDSGSGFRARPFEQTIVVCHRLPYPEAKRHRPSAAVHCEKTQRFRQSSLGNRPPPASDFQYDFVRFPSSVKCALVLPLGIGRANLLKEQASSAKFGVMSEITVKLMRGDGTPWGFRLGGGKDFGYPICVQREDTILTLGINSDRASARL
ncbi:PDZ and LIM domain protein Zasp-like, partial [Tropilaelaps mercedesae]